MILLIPGVASAILFLGAAFFVLGFSSTGEVADPSTLAASLTREQITVAAGGGLLIIVAVAFGMAATVHAAAEPASAGVRAAFARITSKSMQLFWLQAVIYVIALRFSPWAVAVLWFSVAFGIPVALREDLGPSDAMDRAWELSAGSRIRLLVLEVVLWVPILAMFWGVSEVVTVPHAGVNLNQLSPLVRIATAVPITVLLLAPVQFMFVALARGYEMLKRAEAPALHAKAASSVSSS